jgi:ABC-2 type transport system permease protein
VYTGEFRHGTITPTFLVTPRRERVGIAKAAAGLIAGVFLTVAGLAVAAAVLVPWFAARDVSFALGGDVLTTALAVGTLAGLWGVLGVAVGAIVRGQVGAIVGTFVWLFVLEPLVGVLTEDVGEYLPGGAANAVVEQAVDIDLSRAGGLAITAGYAVALTLVGIAVNARRDIA